MAVENRINIINDQAEKLKNSIDKIINPTNVIGDIMKNLADNGITKFDKAIGDMLTTLSKVTGKDYGYTSKNNGFVKSTVIGGKVVFVNYDKDGKMTGTGTAPAYASGTRNAKSGWSLFDEAGLGSESIVTADGVFGNFKGGEKVFNPIQTDNLWNMSNGILPKFDFKVPEFNLPSTKSGDTTNYNINKIEVTDATDIDGIMLDAARKLRARNQLTKNYN